MMYYFRSEGEARRLDFIKLIIALMMLLAVAAAFIFGVRITANMNTEDGNVGASTTISNTTSTGTSTNAAGNTGSASGASGSTSATNSSASSGSSSSASAAASVVALLSPQDGAVLTTPAVTVSGQGLAGANVQLLLDGRIVASTQIGASGTWSLEAMLGVQGEHWISVRALNSLGDVLSATEPVRIIYLDPSGMVPTIDLGTGPFTTGQVTLTGFAQPDFIIKVSVNGVDLGTTKVASDGGWIFLAPLARAGEYRIVLTLLSPEGIEITTLPPQPITVIENPGDLENSSDPGSSSTLPIDGNENSNVGGVSNTGNTGNSTDTTNNAAPNLPALGAGNTNECGLGTRSGQTYVVAHCETLRSIATRVGTTWDALWVANPQIINPNHIFPGQKLSIP